jgi:hypothetical protein
MIRIDNRVLLPFIGPFVLLGLSRLLWWAAGADWTEPEVAAFLSLMVGAAIGVVCAAALWEAKISIGHITIGRAKE